MSIAIAFVARTGIVMGTDSRVTTRGREGATREDAYPKLVEFCGAPVATAMVGAGFYGGRNFRALVAEAHQAWRDEGADGKVEAIAQVIGRTGAAIAKEARIKAPMTVLVGGYSPGEMFAELWEVALPGGKAAKRAAMGSQTFVWRGQTEAVKTLWWGANLGVLDKALKDAGVEPEAAKAVTEQVKREAAWGPERISWGMPLSSAVELVRFQLDVQLAYERFMPGRGTCGPPTQLLAINEAGLRWFDRPFGDFLSSTGK